MDKLFKGGKIVTATSIYKADVAVTGEKITLIGQNIKPDAETEVIDCRGKYVLPGAIDAHTHLAMPFGGTISTDDYETGTRSAACGGTTTVFDFALQDFGETFPDTVKRRDAIAAPQAVVDYSFHIGVKDLSDGIEDTMKDAVAMGVPSFKVFMVYDFGVTDGIFYRVLEKSKEVGALVAVHAENNEMVNYLTQKYIDEKKTSAWYHYMSRPEFVEGEADERAIQWAKNSGAALYIVHLANKQGMDAVTKARDEGYPIFAETCPQYLHFTRDVYKRPDGRNFVCSPPMKDKASQDALWAGIRRGDIQTVATDHCPFKKSEKNWGKKDFRLIPNGCAGIENMYPYMLSEANRGRISFSKAVELCSTNVAKIFGLAGKKGAIECGLDADIVVYDPKKNVTITNKEMHGATDHTVWEGVRVKGYPQAVFSRGNLVYKDGKFLGSKGAGRFVKCDPIKLTSPDLTGSK
ncbi:MAG: dihydropyrimidinase [Clostridiales Family XIII bacterium]|jgi:dihydropyrimidinase|nr:dihydropyrimidinase [Clostridiales Family XIII bacterium]